MTKHVRWGRAFTFVALFVIAIGCFDPLEGSVLILGGAGLACIAAYFGRSRWRNLSAAAFAITLAGVAALFVLSYFGGIGGAHGHSKWWAAVLIPYPIGAVMAIVGAGLVILEANRRLSHRKRALTDWT